jgi:transcriptional regulator with XRE-family HTH domain
MANIQLAANLRYLRELNKQNQEDTGAVFNITRQAYSNYETMTRTPDLDMLVRIATYYDLTLDQLILQDLQHFPEIKEKAPHNMALNQSSGNTIYITDEETDLLTGFRSLSDEDRSVLMGFINSHR